MKMVSMKVLINRGIILLSDTYNIMYQENKYKGVDIMLKGFMLKREMVKILITKQENIVNVLNELLDILEEKHDADSNMVNICVDVVMAGYDGLNIDEVKDVNEKLIFAVDEREETEEKIKRTKKELHDMKKQIILNKIKYLLF